MEQPTLKLIALSPEYIVSYIKKHPIDWVRADRKLASRGGPGDRAGKPPTPSVYEFLALLDERQSLFTQDEFWNHCKCEWKPWIKKKALHKSQVRGLRAKCYRNFYPSMIDSLHAWGLLNSQGDFDVCILDAYEDAVGKSDLILKNGERTLRVALIGPTDKAKSDRQYKIQNRGEANGNPIEVQMDFERPKSPGNKRWYRLDDFERVFSDRQKRFEF